MLYSELTETTVHHRSSIQSHRSRPFGVMGIMHNKRVISSVGIFESNEAA